MNDSCDFFFLAAPSSCLQADKYIHNSNYSPVQVRVSREKKSMWIYKLISLEQKKGGRRGGKIKRQMSLLFTVINFSVAGYRKACL